MRLRARVLARENDRARKRNKKEDALTAAVFVAKIRKSPDVGEIDGETDDRQQKVELASPGFPFVVPAAASASATAAFRRSLHHRGRHRTLGYCDKQE